MKRILFILLYLNCKRWQRLATPCKYLHFVHHRYLLKCIFLSRNYSDEVFASTPHFLISLFFHPYWMFYVSLEVFYLTVGMMHLIRRNCALTLPFTENFSTTVAIVQIRGPEIYYANNFEHQPSCFIRISIDKRQLGKSFCSLLAILNYKEYTKVRY